MFMNKEFIFVESLVPWATRDFCGHGSADHIFGFDETTVVEAGTGNAHSCALFG